MIKKSKIGITGNNGFIGNHLINTIKYKYKFFKIIEFKKSYFKDKKKLESFVQNCDVIFHLAGVNRHEDEKIIYKTNVDLANKIIDACASTNSKPHIIFSSSTQVKLDNAYGKSKKIANEIFFKWAIKAKAKYSNLIIPNVFGPFCKPNYNSVVATFCSQLTNKDKPVIKNDSKLFLIYVGNLVEFMIKLIYKKSQIDESIHIPYDKEIKVSKLLKLLSSFNSSYYNMGIIPNLEKDFEKNLFNTFFSYINHKDFFPFNLKKHSDSRGSFVETVKLHTAGQVSFSTSFPNVVRGNHFHTRKFERFAVISGKAKIDLRRIGSNEILSFFMDGSNPSFVDMPIWYTHNISNIGDDTLYTIFWINEFYNDSDPDTFFENV